MARACTLHAGRASAQGPGGILEASQLSVPLNQGRGVAVPLGIPAAGETSLGRQALGSQLEVSFAVCVMTETECSTNPARLTLGCCQLSLFSLLGLYLDLPVYLAISSSCEMCSASCSMCPFLTLPCQPIPSPMTDEETVIQMSVV